MSLKICPKCSYHRTPTDRAPAWQCPKCGVAYEKAAQAKARVVLRSTATHPDDDDAPPPDQRRSGSRLWLTVLLVMLLGAGGYWAWMRHFGANLDASATPEQKLNGVRVAMKDYNADLAVPVLLELANAGNLKAQIYLAGIYGSDIRSDRHRNYHDLAKALQWLTKAAEQGDMASQLELGILYTGASGWGNLVDKEKATHWLELAAAQGNSTALFVLGDMSLKAAQGPSEETLKGLKLLTQSASMGDLEARYALARLYSEGHLVQLDNPLAYALLTLCAEQGDHNPYAHHGMRAGMNLAEMERRLNATDIEEGKKMAARIKAGQQRLPMPVG